MRNIKGRVTQGTKAFINEITICNNSMQFSHGFQNSYTILLDQQFNLEFQFKSVFNLEFQPEFGIQLWIPILVVINLGDCTLRCDYFYMCILSRQNEQMKLEFELELFQFE